MGEPFMSEIRIMGFDFPPSGWAQCDGQVLPINQNQALFSLLGTAYGGDGRVNFQLPDLRGRVPLHQFAGRTVGTAGGEEAHTVSIQEMPAHTHQVQARADGPAAANPASPSPSRQLSRSSPGNLYGPPSNLQSMHPETIGSMGGSQPHQNLSPFLALNFCIALQGIFPTQN